MCERPLVMRMSNYCAKIEKKNENPLIYVKNMRCFRTQCVKLFGRSAKTAYLCIVKTKQWVLDPKVKGLLREA